MNDMYVKKIEEIGGIKDDKRIDTYISESKIEKIFNANCPESYLHFYELFGACVFKNPIKIKCDIPNPVADDENNVPVDYFYSLNENSSNSVFAIMTQYSDQLPEGYLPLCDGLPGDFICLSLKKSDYGKVYYWYHEGGAGNDLYLVKPNFENFIQGLFINIPIADEKDNEQLDKIKVTVSPALQELLKKSGRGPGNVSK